VDQFSNWRAYYRHEDMERERQFAALLSAVINAGWLAASAFGRAVDEQHFKGPNDFLADDAKLGEPRSRVLSAAESERLAAERYGRR
jgi:hypothetical protein